MDFFLKFSNIFIACKKTVSPISSTVKSYYIPTILKEAYVTNIFCFLTIASELDKPDIQIQNNSFHFYDLEYN